MSYFKGIGKWVIIVVATAAFTSCKDEDPNALHIKEINAINEHLDGLTNSDVVLYDRTGVTIAIHSIGQLPPVNIKQSVKLNYTARLFSNGTTFSSGTLENIVENILPSGLGYSLTAMLVGSNATVYIPSRYGYGPNGTTGVPPNSILVYDITIDEITRTTSQQERFTTDTTAIEQYLDEQSITDIMKHPSGIRYTITDEGSGPSPIPYDRANFTYTGVLISDGSVFDEGTITAPIFDVIDGLIVGMTLLHEGGSATFYIPSGLAYGPSGSTSGSIPGNANLIFTIKLNSVIPFGS